MRPPKGFENEKFPLRHRLLYGAGLSVGSGTLRNVFMPIVRSADTIAAGALDLPSTVKVNPHNVNFEQDAGPLCYQMSIIDRMTISLKFAMTDDCQPSHHSSGTSTNELFTGDDISAINFTWRPIFNIFPEKMDAADDQTGTTVAAILGMTKDATNEDIVPITTNKLNTAGPSELVLPTSTAYGTEVFGDYNMTTNTAMEDHIFDEDLLQEALRRYTNKGALRSCLGRTRHVTLTRDRPFKNFYIDKFVPRAIRRIQPYALFGIQVCLPEDSHSSQYWMIKAAAATKNHIGIKMIVNYHEWNVEHDQDRGVPA